ncbi:hypothetical protein [Ottowia sp. oral taxon 894]|nr:hypothetical protein [Ottowia sp. oral taxon 894]
MLIPASQLQNSRSQPAAPSWQKAGGFFCFLFPPDLMPLAAHAALLA